MTPLSHNPALVPPVGAPAPAPKTKAAAADTGGFTLR